MSTSRALCPGSYDPVTVGHLDVIGRAAAIVDEVVVGIVHNPAKSGTFSVAERTGFLRSAIAAAGWSNVRVEEFARTLVVDIARQVDATVILKGIRDATDVSFELPMARMNRHLSGVETILLPADPAYAHVSSSLVREVAALGGDVSGLVPDDVRDALRARREVDQR